MYLLRRTALAGALVLAAAGALTPAAFADTTDAPAPGTAACTDLVDAQTAVATLQATLNTAVNTLAQAQSAGADPATITNDTTGPDGTQTLTAQLNVLKSTTAKQLCTGSAGTTSTGTTTTTGVPPAIPDRDCRDFDSQEAAQTFFVGHGGSATNDVDGLDANHNGIACEGGTTGDATVHIVTGSTVTAAPSTTTVAPTPTVTSVAPVNPTSSDGSAATGVNSAAVPTGSVNTGYWG